MTHGLNIQGEINCIEKPKIIHRVCIKRGLPRELKHAGEDEVGR